MILLYGSGGHAKVVLDSLASERKLVLGVFDDNLSGEFKGIPVVGKYDASYYPEARVIITIGNNQIRKTVSEKIEHAFAFTVYKENIISADALFDAGSMILQGAIIQADSKIGKHVIVNTRAVVEHDCVVEDFVHLGPGSVICGLAQIGEGTLVGANAVVAPLVKVGKWCQISAGSSVLEDVPDYSLVIGVPGKVVKKLG